MTKGILTFGKQKTVIHRFTLIEMMTAIGISSFIAAATLGVMRNVFWIYQDTTADFYLTQFGRIAREKMLRGDDAKFGLREAYWSSLDSQGDNVNYTTDNDSDDPLNSTNTADSQFEIVDKLNADDRSASPVVLSDSLYFSKNLLARRYSLQLSTRLSIGCTVTTLLSSA